MPCNLDAAVNYHCASDVTLPVLLFFSIVMFYLIEDNCTMHCELLDCSFLTVPAPNCSSLQFAFKFKDFLGRTSSGIRCEVKASHMLRCIRGSKTSRLCGLLYVLPLLEKKQTSRSMSLHVSASFSFFSFWFLSTFLRDFFFSPFVFSLPRPLHIAYRRDIEKLQASVSRIPHTKFSVSFIDKTLKCEERFRSGAVRGAQRIISLSCLQAKSTRHFGFALFLLVISN